MRIPGINTREAVAVQPQRAVTEDERTLNEGLKRLFEAELRARPGSEISKDGANAQRNRAAFSVHQDRRRRREEG